MKEKGITLIALIITIIILLILAGITITLIIGDNGILNRSQSAGKQYLIEAEKEKLRLLIVDVQIDIQQKENREATLEDLQQAMSEEPHKNNYEITLYYASYEDVESIDGKATYAIVKVKNTNYTFTIDNKLQIREVDLTPRIEVSYKITQRAGDKFIASITFKDVDGIDQLIYPNDEKTETYSSQKEVTISYPVEDQKSYLFKVIVNGKEKMAKVTIQVNIEYSLKFYGSYINTGISQSNIVNKNSTLAVRVKINRAKQASVNYMDIFGNHSGSSGMVAQFDGTSTTLTFRYISFDYTPYYDKWVDMVVTFNNTKYALYINGNLMGEKLGTIVPYGNIYLGTAYLSEDRGLRGNISSFNYWNCELTPEEIQKLDVSKETITTHPESIVKSIKFKDAQSIQNAGTMYGSSYAIEETYY